MENGELDGVNPKVIVILAGINNVGTIPGGDVKVENITRGLKALVTLLQRMGVETDKFSSGTGTMRGLEMV